MLPVTEIHEECLEQAWIWGVSVCTLTPEIKLLMATPKEPGWKKFDLCGFDIHIEMPRVDHEKLSADRAGESSEAIRQRVQAARDIQLARFTNHRFISSQSTAIVCNADMRVGEIRQFCQRVPITAFSN